MRFPQHLPDPMHDRFANLILLSKMFNDQRIEELVEMEDLPFFQAGNRCFFLQRHFLEDFECNMI